MKLRLAIVLAVLVAAYVLFPRATPRPAADSRHGSFPGGIETDQQRTGAPLPPSAVAVPPSLRPDERTGVSSGAPHPSSKLGDWSCSDPPNCGETPKPPQKPIIPSSGRVSGTATYYCRPGISRCTRGYPDGMYAAAGPELRALLGDWRGQEVIVTDAIGNVAVVRLIDVCWCPRGSGHVIDLYWTAFQGLVNPVTVRVP